MVCSCLGWLKGTRDMILPDVGDVRIYLYTCVGELSKDVDHVVSGSSDDVQSCTSKSSRQGELGDSVFSATANAM